MEFCTISLWSEVSVLGARIWFPERSLLQQTRREEQGHIVPSGLPGRLKNRASGYAPRGKEKHVSEQKTRLWMVPALKSRQRKGEFGWLPDEVALKAAIESGITPSEKGVVELNDTREVRALLAKVGTITADKAREEFADMKAKAKMLREYNADLVSGDAEFAAALKELELISSINTVAEGLKGRRDFKDDVNRGWSAYNAANARKLPKRQEYAAKLYQAAVDAAKGDEVALSAVAEAYAKVTAEDAKLPDVESFIHKMRALGLKVARENTGNGGNSEAFSNTPRTVEHDPSSEPWKPKTTRGKAKKDGKHYQRRTSEDRSA